MDRIPRGADGLQREEEGHAVHRGEEQEAAAPAVDLERDEDGPEQVPDGEDAGVEELDVGVGDADRVEDLIELVEHEAVAGPPREPRDDDDDVHAPAPNEVRPTPISASASESEFELWVLLSPLFGEDEEV